VNQPNPFKWRHFEAEMILLCVRWYLRYSLSYRDLEEMMRERGLQVDHTTIYRWVQRYAPELDKRCRPHVKAFTDSWKVDETYIKVRKTWMDQYRAVDSQGNTLEFLLSATRDAEAAKRFFLKALHSMACSAPQVRPLKERVEEPLAPVDLITPTSAPAVQEPMAPATPKTTASAPRVINVDKNAAYPKAIAQLKAAGILPEQVELRQVKNLNNLIEQDHRFIKRRVKPGMDFFSMETAGRTLQGYEAMHMIRKGQMQGVNKGDITGQVTFIARLFGMVA
jgi:transposase-like protein